jgi:hypothetical protein
MQVRAVAVLGVPMIAAGAIWLGYSAWLSSASREVLPDPASFPVKCEPPATQPAVILDTVEAARVLQSRCILGDPTQVESWFPSESAVAAFEAQLPGYWSTTYGSSWRFKPLESYIRQYAGFVLNGRPGICVNMVTKSSLELDAYVYREKPELSAKLPNGVCPEDLWRHQAVGLYVADGGSDYCWVRFEVMTKEITDSGCNGL